MHFTSFCNSDMNINENRKDMNAKHPTIKTTLHYPIVEAGAVCIERRLTS